MFRFHDTIRGATLIHGMTRALSGIPSYPRQITSAFNVAEYSEMLKSFDRALGSPFGKAFVPQSHRLRLSVTKRFYVLLFFNGLTHYITKVCLVSTVFVFFSVWLSLLPKPHAPLL